MGFTASAAGDASPNDPQQQWGAGTDGNAGQAPKIPVEMIVELDID